METNERIMKNVNYKVSLHKSVSSARWNIKKDKGNIILYVSNIWDEFPNFDYFIEYCIYYTLMERICLERAFNKVRIKGGRCNPCCVVNITKEIYRSF